jgi:hypothetical protein
MNHLIRGTLLGSVTMALLGLAGCGEDNEKRASEDFKNTTTAPAELKPVTKSDMQQRYGMGKTYPGKAVPKAPAGGDSKAK